MFTGFEYNTSVIKCKMRKNKMFFMMIIFYDKVFYDCI